MIGKEKKTILDIRAADKPYKEISAELGTGIPALKEFVHRQKKPGARKCANCGKRLPKKANAIQRFCHMKCKNAWWKWHPYQDGNDKRIVHTCAFCGRKIISYMDNENWEEDAQICEDRAAAYVHHMYHYSELDHRSRFC